MIRITPHIAIDEAEIDESFVRADGPGGQNVNKVASAVQLRFDAARSKALPEPARARLMRLGRGKITTDGVIVILAKRFRDQIRNREDARQRLAELIRKALIEPKIRKKTKPSLAARQERLTDKKQRGRLKQQRGRMKGDVD